MANPFTRVSVTGYNASPPPDDGSNTADNQVNWSKHKQKLADPIKNALEALDSNVHTAFGTIVGGGGDLADPTTIASAATTDVLGAASYFVTVSGTSTITSLGSDANRVRFVTAGGAFTLTHNATSLILPDGANITAAAGDTFIVTSDGSGNARVLAYQRKGGMALRGSAGHIFGLTLSNNASDAEHDIDIAIGEAASDGTDPVLMRLTSAVTKQFDNTFAEGTGLGGMVSGESLPTSGTIHVWLIMKADGTVDVCANNHASSGLSPTLPTDFIYKRRIGSLRTDASANIRAFSQVGDEFLLAASVLDVSANNPGTSAVLRTMTVPAGLKIGWIGIAAARNTNASTGTVNFYISSPDQNDEAPADNAAPLHEGRSLNAAGGNLAPASRFWGIRTDTSGQLRSRADASVAGFTLFMATHGWLDTRGRLA